MEADPSYNPWAGSETQHLSFLQIKPLRSHFYLHLNIHPGRIHRGDLDDLMMTPDRCLFASTFLIALWSDLKQIHHMWQRLLNRQQEEADHHTRVSLSRNHDGVDRDNPQTVLCFTQELFSFYRMCRRKSASTRGRARSLRPLTLKMQWGDFWTEILLFSFLLMCFYLSINSWIYPVPSQTSH